MYHLLVKVTFALQKMGFLRLSKILAKKCNKLSKKGKRK